MRTICNQKNGGRIRKGAAALNLPALALVVEPPFAPGLAAAIAPAFYQSAWFFLGIAGLGLALGFAGLYALRARDLAQREKKLLRLVDEKTQALHAEIAERTRAEEAVRESEALYHSLVENLPINIYRKNCEGRFTFANTLFSETIGKPLEEIIGKTDYDFSDRELADKYRRDDARMMREGTGFQDVEKHLNVNGRQTHIQIMKTPLRGSDGSIRGTQGMFFDITDRVRAEQDLEYERDLLRTLLDYSPDHIYFKDLESRFLRCSATLCRRLGLANQNEAIGRSDADFFDSEHAQDALADEQRIMQTGQPIIGKVEREVWSTGRTAWVLTSKHVFRDRDGCVIGTFGISKDITAIKEAELEVERLHRQLVDASRQAGMAEVATNVLHNVGNVLNSVNVSTTLLAEKVGHSKASSVGKVAALLQANAEDLGAFFASDPKGRQLPGYLTDLAGHLAAEQEEMLQEIASLAQNIDHIKEIVAMQQSYSSVAGIRETLAVIDLVEDAVRLNAGALGRHAVEVVRDYSPVPDVCVEKHKVLQILVNLIRNAKYALDESGGACRRLTLRVGAEGPDLVQISVIDNGVGIPAENLQRIFTHGFTTRKEGHGFGLHSAALAAGDLGGSLRASSDGSGCGACFTLTLPLSPDPANHNTG